MITAWYPFSTAFTRLNVATTVLPEPTSPCNNRCIGRSSCMSCEISVTARS